MGIPYNLAAGWVGGLLSTFVFAISAQTGSIFILSLVALYFFRETRDIDITTTNKVKERAADALAAGNMPSCPDDPHGRRGTTPGAHFSVTPPLSCKAATSCRSRSRSR
ncbi:hypothetical protein LMG23994_07042 [Cupriavidus pinatubonensis]|uniref:Uncharacterized protein n=1 Tax=Cupriavidus pinatubonensis TaxID=248026 RepID=A0ABM8Y493_9BURK|nr:hypothetical protein LMG23994_07042 [Cupriavidus pinatubonensis]